MKKLLLALILLTQLHASPILKLDTGGHTSTIKKVIITQNQEIITASDDKTIRVWDSHTGREKRKILGEIGAGSGEIYAMALSPDEKFLAVGGYLAGEERSDKTAIRIYNYKTAKLLKVLKSHTNVIYDLSFSADGGYLISGSDDTTAKIWKSSSFKLLDTITTHSKQVYAVKIIKRGKRVIAITAGYDNKISLYDIQKKEVLKTKTLEYKLDSLATNGKHIATSGDGKEIKIFDTSLKLIKTIESQTEPAGLAYSHNGKYLIVGTSSTPYNINIYNSSYTLISSFKKHTNSTMAVGFLDNHTAISAGGDNREIYIWDRESKEVSQKIVGVGERVWSVGIEGDTIAWGNKWTGDSHSIGSKLQKNLNLKTMQIASFKKPKPYHGIKTKKGKYTLSHKAGGDYGYGDTVLEIEKSGNSYATITRGATDGYRHNCYGFYKKYIISGGTNGYLKIYTLKGKEVANLVGHTGEVWSIAVDGDRLISGGDDQTMMVWDLKSLSDSMKPMLSIFVSADNEWVVWSESGYFNASVGGDKYVGYHINQGSDSEARYVSSDKYFDTLYRPDIISLIWKSGSEKKAIAFAGERRKVNTVDIATSLPPVVSLLSPSNISTAKDTIEIRYSIESKEPITQTIITLNGKKLNTRAIIKKQKNRSQTLRIELENAENIISIKAKNRFAMSDEVLIYANKKSQVANIYKPTLYLLSVGVSQYRDSTLNLGVADKDAQAMSEIFEAQKGRIYKDVKTKTITNADATKDNILDGLDWIDKEATSKDVIILFIAGHGVNDDNGNYYFLSYEANMDKLRRTAVKWSEIQDTITNLPSKVILLADTCHSGNIAGTRRDVTSAIKSIINSGTGTIIMTATTGRGYSYEKRQWGHGAFTKAILEGIEYSKADYDEDKTISIKELDLYITNRVKKLTDGKQKPTTIIPQSVPDFAIGMGE